MGKLQGLAAAVSLGNAVLCLFNYSLGKRVKIRGE